MIGLITKREAAYSLGFTPRWLEKQVRLRRVAAHKFGFAVRFDPQEIERLKAEHEKKARSL